MKLCLPHSPFLASYPENFVLINSGSEPCDEVALILKDRPESEHLLKHLAKYNCTIRKEETETIILTAGNKGRAGIGAPGWKRRARPRGRSDDTAAKQLIIRGGKKSQPYIYSTSILWVGGGLSKNKGTGLAPPVARPTAVQGALHLTCT